MFVVFFFLFFCWYVVYRLDFLFWDSLFRILYKGKFFVYVVGFNMLVGVGINFL